MNDLWSAVLLRIAGRIGTKSYQDWFEPTRLHSITEDVIRVEVPNALFQGWLEKNFRDVILEALAETERELGEPRSRSVEFTVGGQVQAPAAQRTIEPGRSVRPRAKRTASRRRQDPSSPTLFSKEELERASATPPAEPTGPKLDPRYTFDNFVVGSCNQFAHAAARAVADTPGKSYNPLYLYGGVGLGKTHLMQAIGLALQEAHPELKLAYVSAERFMCEMINAIRWKRQPDFRDRYRSIDVLLVDDVQFLEGKEATQEEFFHTFRTLYEDGKQVVLSSDCPPRDLATLEDRLRSRFQSGLIADMQVPDLETKLAILRRQAEREGATLSDEVALHLSNQARSNVRELEGCLTRILALASLRGREPDIELAREATRDMFPDQSKPVTVESIQRMVAAYYNVKVSDLKARNNARSVTLPRQVAMYLCKKMTTASFPDIGKKFGGKHHSTVIHSVNKIQSEAAKSEELTALLGQFMESIQ